ncbi:hypothetical protein Dimus_025681 [Dionaea muscipula]
MARLLSRTLNLTLTNFSTQLSIFPSSRLLACRHRSEKAQLIEIDLDSSSSSGDGASGGFEKSAVKMLEDFVHGIIVRRSAPDWIPFIPGASFWVPPGPRAPQIIEVVRKFTNPLSEEEQLSIATVNGWPCSSFFLDGNFLLGFFLSCIGIAIFFFYIGLIYTDQRIHPGMRKRFVEFYILSKMLGNRR